MNQIDSKMGIIAKMPMPMKALILDKLRAPGWDIDAETMLTEVVKSVEVPMA